MSFLSIKKRFGEFVRSLDADDIEQFKAYMQIEFDRSLSKLISDVQSNADDQQHAYSAPGDFLIASSNQHEANMSPAFRSSSSSQLSTTATGNRNGTRSSHNSSSQQQQQFNANNMPGETCYS